MQLPSLDLLKGEKAKTEVHAKLISGTFLRQFVSQERECAMFVLKHLKFSLICILN